MTDSPPLTFSVLAAGMLRRWNLAAMVFGGTLIVAAALVLILSPLYEARASFITGGNIASFTGASSSDGLAQFPVLGGYGDPSASPRFNVQLIESAELRRRLLYSRFHDPRGTSSRDSATLLSILRPRSDDPQRRVEIALRRLSRVVSARVDGRTGLVEVTVLLPWADLAAAVANRTTQLAASFNAEQHLSRSKSVRVFLQARVDSARIQLRTAEDRQRQFFERNRDWRNSPQLASQEAQLGLDETLAKALFMTLEHQLETAQLSDVADGALVTIVDHAIPPRKRDWPRYGLLLGDAIAVGLILGLFVTAVTTIVADRRNRKPAPIANGAVSRRPDAERSLFSSVVFPLFAWGIVFHSLIIAALFGWVGLPEQTVRTLAAWKEIALAALCLFVIIRAMTGFGPRTTFAWSDLWVAGLVGLAVLFFLTENLWLRFNLPVAAQQLGIRDAVYFMFAYFVGRAMPEIISDERATRKIFFLILATCVIGVLERFIVTPEMLVGIGVASYFQDFLGVSAFTTGNDFGLPQNYWTMIGGNMFRRAGSVYLSGQGFAVPFLLFFPLATAWVFLRRKWSLGYVTAYLIIAAGLVLTLTRMTIIVAVVQLILFTCLRRRPTWAVGAVAVTAAGFMAAFALIPGFPTFVWHTLSWQEGSSVSHVNDWVSGVSVLAQNPWGSGLGTTDQTAVRAGLLPLTGDNLFLKYGVELGVAGLILLVFILASFAHYGRRLFSQGVTLNQQRIGITLLLASIGIVINGLTASVFNSPALGWLFFWIAGAAVTAASQLPTAFSPRQ